MNTDKDGYQYEYDYENRITKIIKSGPTTVAEFAYDALGRRIKKRDSIANTNNIYYYNDNWQILCDYNDAGTPQSWFAYGNYIDEAVLMSKSFTSWLSARYYIQDHLYSPAALMGATGAAPIERYEYDAYGKCYIMDASYNPRSSSLYGNPYYFTGRELDFLDSGNLKIQYNRNRYYDYYTGRWLTPDPLGITPAGRVYDIFLPENQFMDGLNVYQYVRSSPINSNDSMGLICEDECDKPGDTKIGMFSIVPVPHGHSARGLRTRIALLKWVGYVEGVGKATGVIGKAAASYAGMLGGFHFEIKADNVRCCNLENCCHIIYGNIVRLDWEGVKITKRYPEDEHEELDLHDESEKDPEGRTVVDLYLDHFMKAVQYFKEQCEKKCWDRYLRGIRCGLRRWR